MTALFNIIIYMSFISVFVFAVIILVRGTIGKKLPAVVRYFLWAILIFRLIVPISFSSEASLLNFYPVTIQSQVSNSEEKESLNEHTNVSNLKEEQSTGNEIINIESNYIPVIWFMITGMLMGFFVVTYIFTMNRFQVAIICQKQELGEMLFHLANQKKIKIYKMDGLKTPVVCGIIRPKIIIPAYLIAKENETILKNAIQHELVHIQRKDYLIKLVALFVACIHWFNPIVWIALILGNRDMEIACDEKVIRHEPAEKRIEYAQALLSFTLKPEERENATLIAFGESNTKTRLRAVLSYKKPKLKVKLLSGFIVVAIVLLVATDASSKIELVNLDLLKQQNMDEWVELDDVSPYIVQAAILSQDNNFKSHNGIDIMAILRAGFNDLKGNKPTQGGTTITQQFVNTVCKFDGAQGIGKKRSEMYTAIKLEKNYSKDEIIEAYLNCIYFGNDIIGIKNAAGYYFNKQPSELTKEEAAKLLAIIDDPSMYDPMKQPGNNEIRAQTILDKMDEINGG
ncbi:transglycosylase domain-containing protein [Acetobacterium woodii]|uniref:Penicillin-binding protein 1A n=1 Tax=Acetobacterium woodii (strain ATCC 29683 / DSM 1030 / JCM 2381 / KCTC 1655 / WB1) TaxID=931626 RepID=H6LKX8_ACEWD|nr:transglycosylase domain-containing protein [Acetobacterium woodii]AFA50087.1 putative peptidase M56, BlaR1 [Acetobacterium woodii DSM 1030]